MEINPAYIIDRTRSGEVPKYLPKIEYKGTPEQYNLPYRVCVDQDKLALFIKALGVPEEKITKAKITISYKPGLVAGYVNLFNGNATIFAGDIQRKVLERYNQLEKKEKHKGKFIDRLKGIKSGITKFLATEVYYELKEKNMSDLIPRIEKSRLDDLRSAAGISTEDGKEIAELGIHQYLTEIMDRQIRTTVPHELIHMRQVKTGEALRRTSVAVGFSIFFDTAISSLYAHLLDKTPKVVDRYGKNAGVAARAGLVGALAYSKIKSIYLTRKVQGLEYEAYRKMGKFEDVFSDIITLEPTQVSMQDALDASRTKKNYKVDKKIFVGQFNAISG